MNQKGKLINSGYSPVGIDLGVCMLSHFSCVRLFATLWTVAHQAPLSMGFSRQEYLSGFPCPPPGDLLNPGIKAVSLMSPALQADSLPLASPEGSDSRRSQYGFACLSVVWVHSGGDSHWGAP